MKRKLSSILSSRNKKIACTVSAAALMLGVSSAATVGLHFQCDYYCSSNLAYTGFPVTLTAFGIPPNGWENLTQTPTGYHSCVFVSPGYTFDETIDTTTSTNGLNPLPNGSIDVTWFANCANFNPFAGYVASPPYYEEEGGHAGSSMLDTNPASGEELVYATFLRDGINFGPSAGNADNPLQAYYSIDVTGLKSLFTNTPFVVELMASSDSMNLLTNALVTDVSNSITYSLPYPNTAPVNPQGGAPWQRGIGGGLSLVSGVFSNADHIHIASNIPQHGGNGPPPTGFDNAGTISGFIFTDKPVVTMSPQPIALAGPGDTNILSAYAIGVPPLAYQWRLNGQNIPGATDLSYTNIISTLASGGNYDLVVTNLYGAATSKVATVTVDKITQGSISSNVVYDSNPDNAQHDGVNMGATWEASSSDGTVTRTGVMSFVATNATGITVADNSAFDGPTGTITLWLRSPGTDSSAPGNQEAPLICRTNGGIGDDFLFSQNDTGTLSFEASATVNQFNSKGNVSDNKWHFVALTFDQSTNGGAALYIDGALDTTNSNAGASWSWPAGQPIEIGYTSDLYWRDYNGLLDGVRYYNAILSPSQISAIYSSGNGDGSVDPTALQLEFDFTAPPAGGILLNWQESTAVLQSAPTVAGPWTDVTGATSPYTIVPAANQQFFRYRYVPQSQVSNPYLM